MITFSREEIRDITIAVIALTVLYSLSVTRPFGWSVDSLLLFLPISFIAVGLGFILHELGHKVVAQRFGFFSEFRKWNYGLILGLLTVPLGFMIFAPGAVYFGSYGRMVTDEENGKISIAGPIVNIVLALIALFLTLSLRSYLTMENAGMMYIVLLTLVLTFNVNSFLALFNLLPIPPLDGSKVIQWNLPIYIITIAVAGILTYMSYTITLI
ncbi:site-2 protease family protein [Methanosphaera sp.]|uniref:site-2 protease family protein n=1 Tax=Methanosphaera sp. TaxID=2666342 RepID=UPI0025FDACE7|nr:site-2 protease family protein [Methanosphaera sp.]MEE1117689.1 site-2 protease family protein [Methanosphaera sp.]MEE3324502.1 site-2 protease family protein [Methanosphaera sp.]MEE3417972.1 site-2 protease family protein [Methanosphaera sp.]